MPADNEAAAAAWNNAMKDVIERARARKCERLENVRTESEKIRVIPIKSAS
jgi:hypothetical protein